MKIQNIIHANESYTHKNWVYRNISAGFSRLYYVLDGEAYYEEEGKRIRLRQNCLYLTPVKKHFTLYDNPNDPLLHTYAHVFTAPVIGELTEIEVKESTPLADAVALWRKYIRTEDAELLVNVTQLVLSCAFRHKPRESELGMRIKTALESFEGERLDMEALSRLLGYSREYMTRSFSAVYGITPKQYFNLHRMQTALRRLSEGARVGEVAAELRFASPYSFSKAFKAHYGMSPKHYLQTLHGSVGV